LPPLASETGVRDELAQRSRDRFGRPAEVVESERHAMRERILQLRARQITSALQQSVAAIAPQPPTLQPAGVAAQAPTPAKASARSGPRRRKKRRAAETADAVPA